MSVGGETDQIVDRAAGMADLQPQVPEQVERCLDDLLGPAGRLPRGDERYVDVRMERHLAPSIAADRHQRETLPRRRIGDGSERSEEHTSELQSLMRISYAVFCLKKKRRQQCIPQQSTTEITSLHH